MAVLSAVAALAWSGRAAWVAGAGLGLCCVAFWRVLGDSPVATVMFTVPAYFAGTVLRLRQGAADALLQRGRELGEEQEIFADLSMRHERARIVASCTTSDAPGRHPGASSSSGRHTQVAGFSAVALASTE